MLDFFEGSPKDGVVGGFAASIMRSGQGRFRTDHLKRCCIVISWALLARGVRVNPEAGRNWAGNGPPDPPLRCWSCKRGVGGHKVEIRPDSGRQADQQNSRLISADAQFRPGGDQTGIGREISLATSAREVLGNRVGARQI